MKTRLIDEASREFHRLWVIRVSLFFGVLNACALGLAAFYDSINPWLFLALNVVVQLLLIPAARLAKQADSPEPTA